MSQDNIISAHILALQAQKSAQTEEIAQISSSEEFSEWTEVGNIFNPVAMARRFETLETKMRRKGEKEESEKAEQKEETVLEIKKVEEVSEQYQRKNPELQSRSLLSLRERILRSDTKEDILRKVLTTYPDHALADEALDFLIETSDVQLAQNLSAAKEDLNAQYGREVRSGRNMGTEARAYASQGLGTPTTLRDLYRDITGNPRDPTTLFEELTSIFTYERMKTVISFLLHSLGSDLRAKGPSIERAELQRLLSEARVLQAIQGVYRFFLSRMRLIAGAFVRSGQLIPPHVTFENLAKQFVRFITERYPSAEKVFQLGEKLGISRDALSQMIIYTQMRDAVRGVSMRLFRSEQHRQDILTSFMEALEELEEEAEEEEDEEERELK